MQAKTMSPRALAALLLAAISVAGLAAALAIPLDDPSQITPPEGRAGDVVTYLDLVVAQDPANETVLVEGRWTIQGIHEYRIGPIRTMTDVRGVDRRAVAIERIVVAEDAITPCMMGGPFFDENGSIVPANPNTVCPQELEFIDAEVGARYLVDLDRREVFQASMNRPWGENRTEFQPESPWTQDPFIRAVLRQGVAIRLGELLLPPVRIGSEPFSAGTHSERVESRGHINGSAALIVLKETQSIKPKFDDEAYHYSGKTMRAWETVRSWISASSPYPLVIDHEMHDEESRGYEGRFVMTRLDPGETPLDLGPAPPAAEPPTIALTTSTPAPLDERGAGLAYTLDAADADVAAHPQLAGFRAWRDAHGDARMLGAELVEGNNDTRALRWLFLWATPDGDARIIEVERSGSDQVVFALDHGPRRMTPSENRFPAAMPALAEAVAAWRNYAAAPFRESPVNRLSWGLIAWQEEDRTSPSFPPPFGHFGMADPDSPPGTRIQPCDVNRTFTPTGENGITETRYAFTIGYADPKICAAGPESSLMSFESDDGAPTRLVETKYDGRNNARFFGLPGGGPLVTAESVRSGLTMPRFERSSILIGSLLFALAAAYVSPSLKFYATKLGLLAGYSKLRRNKLMDHANREAIVQAIQQDPGVHASEIANRLQLGWGTTVHHLGVLEKNGLATSFTHGRFRRFFPAGVTPSERNRIAALRNPTTRSILDAIQQRPGIIQQDLLQNVRLSRAAGYFHLRRLERAGLIQRTRAGHAFQYRPAASAGIEPRLPA